MVVIVAVLLAAGVISLGGRDNQQQRQIWTQTQSMLQMACDQAAFNQRVYLVSVSEQGLEAYYRQQGEWQPAKINKVSWTAEQPKAWTVNEQLTELWQLPEMGWLCWPSGLVSEGEIRMSNSGSATEQVLRWDEGLNFVFEN